MVQPASANKNIWVAASDGDITRVKVCASLHFDFDFPADQPAPDRGRGSIAQYQRLQLLHANVRPPSPIDAAIQALISRHAAASYHHFELLEYLLSVGGDINIPDAEGETPLFTVEGAEAARWLVEHGADVAAENGDGQAVSCLLILLCLG